MFKRCTCFTFLIVLLALAQGGTASGAWDPLEDPALVGWWPFDETSGTTAADISTYARAGTLTGGATWTAGRFGGGVQLDGTSGYVTVPSFPLTTDSITLVAWINGWKAADWAAIITGQPARLELGFGANNTLHYTWNSDSSATYNWTNGPVIPQDAWAMVAVTIDPAKAIAYVYTDAAGLQQGTNTLAHTSQAFSVLSMGWSFDTRYVRGILDEVAVFSRALTEEEILVLTKGPKDPALASALTPADAATDVPRDVSLSWLMGEGATTHNVYFGTSFDDVSNATQPSQSQTETLYDPQGLLEFGQTYFWRIDEVTADGTVFTGEVWSFEVEPFAYPIADVIATSTSTNQTGMGPQNTVNGSGLNEYDEHGVDQKTMWVATSVMPHVIQFAFDKVYKLDEMWVWNANSQLESAMGFGARTVAIECSVDGETWTPVENVPEFAQGTGEPTYTANTKVDLAGAAAQYVKLTITANWGGVTPQVSLSEVRFYQIPVQAREPEPADGETEVALDTTLNWRPGREATSHEVYFGTDANAVAEGTVAAKTVTDHRYTPASMDFGTLYYWRVDEVGDAETYAGNVWNFTSQEFAVVEDFESYTDDIEAEETIWHAWTDGVASGVSGSQVGYDDSPFAEQEIVHSGKQSMPMLYDNDGTFRENTEYERTGVPFYSEAERGFSPAQNWTRNGADEVSLWVHGYPALGPATMTEAGGKIALTGGGADIWYQSDEFSFAYKTLTGDGAMIARVVSTGTGTQTWAKGGVMIRDSLRGGSTHAMMVMTTPGANGASFQYRANTDGDSAGSDSVAAVAVPYWVKIERFGSTFTGYTSADGKTWATVGTAEVTVQDPVYIGLCVTAHLATEERTFEFDSMATTGAVAGAWQGVVIASADYNVAANMHLLIQDSAGKSGSATNADLVTSADWTRWAIPMSDFAGVNFGKVARIAITIGDKDATTAGGSGMVFIDDIGFGSSAEQ